MTTVQPLLIYPEKKEIALSNLAVHWFFNAFSDYKPDLITTDFHEGILYKRKIQNTPFVFVSVSYGVSFLNVAAIFKHNGIPLLKKDRENGMFPIFICGGIAALLNPEPLCQIFDAVFLGEGECMESDIKKLLNMETREDVFDLLSKLDYSMTDLKKTANAVIAPEGTFFVHSNETLHKMGNCFNNRQIVEINRGCTSRCKFCAATYAYRVFRETDCVKVLEFAELAIERKEGLGLMGTSLASVSCFDVLLERCAQSNCSISLSSLKISEINEKRIALLKKCGVKTVTVAVESADIETRKRILKKIDDEQIFSAMRILKDFNIKPKIYIIAGLPETEILKEVESLFILLKKLKEQGITGEISLSVAPFSPKPLTPFKNSRFIDKKEYKKYMTLLKTHISKLDGKIKVDFFSYDESELDYKFGLYKGPRFLELIEENIHRGHNA